MHSQFFDFLLHHATFQEDQTTALDLEKVYTSRNQIAFKTAVNVFWLNTSISFSISSYSGSRTFKAHIDTLLEANRSFENGRNLM